MDSPLSKGVDGLANIVVQKWFAGMGLVGLLLFVTALVIETPTDPVIVRCVGLMMMGWGFGQTECRTFQEIIDVPYKVIRPAWKWSVTGVLMFAIAIGAAVHLLLTVFDLEIF